MAKVWKPKYWDTNNPPDVGSRVFVGRANGASSYETISAGQTKRILQSNGRGNIFYGNVTVYYSPFEPALTSNLPVGDYSSNNSTSGDCIVHMRLIPSGASTVALNAGYETSDNFNFREGTLTRRDTGTNNNLLNSVAPGSCNNAVALANKITIYVNNSTWYIANIRGRTAISTLGVGYTYERVYVMALSGGLNPSDSVDVRTVKNAIDDAIDGGQTVRIILSNEPTWVN